MSDYISRAELDRIIHLLHTECAYDMPSFDSKNGYKVIPTRYHKGYQQSLIDLESRIAELPSADVRENRWIPVSERLPKAFETVLRTRVENGWNGTTYTIVDIGCICPADHNIVAWMSLPEPYKADMRGET